jgi:hypothetical protein
MKIFLRCTQTKNGIIEQVCNISYEKKQRNIGITDQLMERSAYQRSKQSGCKQISHSGTGRWKTSLEVKKQ